MSLGRMVETMPDLTAVLTNETRQWLGRTYALLDAAHKGTMDVAKFSVAMDTVLTTNNIAYRAKATDEIKAVLYRALGVAELKAPVKSQGAFIPAGDVFDAFAAISKILGNVKSEVLIVDPYLDDTVLSKYVPTCAARVGVKLLADSNPQWLKPSLAPAVAAWSKQYPADRRIEARVTPSRTLHDRLILVDQTDVYISTQSFNALAARSPASIVRVEPEAAALKIDAYSQLWANAQLLT